MLRPTPVRLLYLLVGLVIGGVALVAYVEFAGMPTFVPALVPGMGTAQVTKPTTAEFTGRTLVKVLPVNREATKSNVSLRINSLEEYSHGFSLTYSIISGQNGEPAPVYRPDLFRVTDDRGETYQLNNLGSTGTVGPGLSVGYLTFRPALNPGAKSLTVSVLHLIVVSGPVTTDTPRIVDGPWQVQVPLH